MEIREIRAREALERCYPVMRELREGLTLERFLDVYERASEADGYTLVAVLDGVTPIALMGYRVLHDYVHGRHVYIDDLVTTAAYRSRGLGAKLLAYAEKEARRLDCSNLRLCTGVANEAGMRFYEREGWQSRAVVYKKRLDAVE